MDGVRTAFQSCFDDFIDVEVTFFRRSRADGIRFVGQHDVFRHAVGFGEKSYRTDSHFATGTDDSDGDFSSVGYNDFFDHSLYDLGFTIGAYRGLIPVE